MATATKRDLFVEGFSGADANTVVYELQLSLQNSDGSPMTIEGALSSFKAKRTYTDANALIDINQSNGIEVNANTSTLTLQMTVGDFNNVNLNRESTDLVYDWDLTLSGRKYRLLRGNLTVGGDI